MLADLRLAARMLLKAKGWTAVVLVSLALGTGANTALFSAVNGLMLRKLAVDSPDRLVRFRHVGRNEMVSSSSDYGPVTIEGSLPTRTTFSYPMFQELQKANETLTDMFAGASSRTLSYFTSRTTPTISICPLVSGLLPKWRPSGLSSGKNLRTAASLMMATFGAVSLSRDVKARPMSKRISIVSKKFGAILTRLISLCGPRV